MSSTSQGKGWDVLDSQDRARFEQVVLPHLDAAFNLSRWLLRNRSDAEDVAQEAMLRAFRFFRGFNGGDARAWLLQIVRNTCYTWLEKNRQVELMTEFDEDLHQQSSATPGNSGHRGRQSRPAGTSARDASRALSGSNHSSGTRGSFVQRDRLNYQRPDRHRHVRARTGAPTPAACAYATCPAGGAT